MFPLKPGIQWVCLRIGTAVFDFFKNFLRHADVSFQNLVLKPIPEDRKKVNWVVCVVRCNEYVGIK